MNIEEFNKFNNFIGYGNSCNPELVFFGLEEGAGQDDFDENLNYRINNLNTSCFKDLEEFHAHAEAPPSMRRWYETPGHVEIQRTWTRYCALILSMQGMSVDRENRRNYQENMLGSLNGETLLIERYPLPRYNHNKWEDQLNVEGLFTGLQEYFNYCNNDEIRKNLIMNVLRAEDFCPKAIVVHGANAVRGILDFFNDDNELQINPIPVPIEGLPVSENWNYYEWEKINGNVKIIFMPFIQGYRGVSIEMETHLVDLGKWISGL
tara:strand:+ start:701 stop:1492 length:792 start_codon:yes stop_codon:yes gene_type:complete